MEGDLTQHPHHHFFLWCQSAGMSTEAGMMMIIGGDDENWWKMMTIWALHYEMLVKNALAHPQYGMLQPHNCFITFVCRMCKRAWMGYVFVCGLGYVYVWEYVCGDKSSWAEALPPPRGPSVRGGAQATTTPNSSRSAPSKARGDVWHASGLPEPMWALG